MTANTFKGKGKADLLEIVRLSQIMPVDEAEQMTTAQLQRRLKALQNAETTNTAEKSSTRSEKPASKTRAKSAKKIPPEPTSPLEKSPLENSDAAADKPKAKRSSTRKTNVAATEKAERLEEQAPEADAASSSTPDEAPGEASTQKHRGRPKKTKIDTGGEQNNQAAVDVSGEKVSAHAAESVADAAAESVGAPAEKAPDAAAAAAAGSVADSGDETTAVTAAENTVASGEVKTAVTAPEIPSDSSDEQSASASDVNHEIESSSSSNKSVPRSNTGRRRQQTNSRDRNSQANYIDKGKDSKTSENSQLKPESKAEGENSETKSAAAAVPVQELPVSVITSSLNELTEAGGAETGGAETGGGADQADVTSTSGNVSENGKHNKHKFENRPITFGEDVSGVLELMPDGYGFLRRDNYLQGPKDIYVPPQFIRRFNLREGDFICGPGRMQRDSDRYQALQFIKTVNGETTDKVFRRVNFDRLTPVYPNQMFKLETLRNELSTRIVDLISPIGKGQRGMIVSPPKAGKTILLQKIANAISINNPETKLIVLLIDERPEEVTDMQRSINGEVVYSTFDKTPENHVKIAELVLARAMRLVEMGQDVVILLDSITRLSRAYNLTINPTGRTLSGGLDPGALYGPKRFFGAARKIENGGSLTIIATALIDTGSRMDEVIFEEFKGTGNMEVYLDRKLSEKRIFPAIDINRSGTRREELLLEQHALDAVWSIRKAFGQLDSGNVTETIINLLLKTQDNRQFISSINVSLSNKGLFDSMRLGQGQNGK